MAVTDAGTRWPRSRLAIGLLLSLVVLLVLGGFSFFTALSLQRQAAVQYAIGRLDPELSVALQRPLRLPELASTAHALLQQPWGLRRVIVRDVDGLLLAHAGAYEALDLGNRAPGRVIENFLSALTSPPLSTLVRADAGRGQCRPQT